MKVKCIEDRVYSNLFEEFVNNSRVCYLKKNEIYDVMERKMFKPNEMHWITKGGLHYKIDDRWYFYSRFIKLNSNLNNNIKVL